MKLFALVLVLLATACEKTSDVGAIQDEANGVVNTYRARFEQLTARYKTLDDLRQTSQSAKDAPDAAQAGTLMNATKAKLTDMQSMIKNAPQTIANKAKPETPRAELIGTLEDYKRRFEAGNREINRNLNITETWLANAELRQKRVAVQTPPPSEPPPPSPEVPEAGSGSAAGSGAPVQ
jgi:hypothetical protein